MNLTDKQRQWLAWLIVAVVLTAVSVGLGVTYPLPPIPLETEEVIGAQSVRYTDFQNVKVANDFWVVDDVDIDGDVDVAGTLNADTVDFDGALDMGNNAITNIGAAGTDFSATGGLTLADDLNMSNQPVVNIGAAGTDFDANGGLTTASTITATTGGINVIAGTSYFGVDGTGTDVYLYSDTAGDAMQWDQANEQLIITGTNGQTALDVADGNLAVTDNATVGGTLGVTGASTLGSDVTISAVADGGNAGAKNELAGLVRIKGVALGTMVNGSTETISYMDDTPTGEWTEADAGTNLALSADTTYYRVGTASLKIAFTDVVTDDGAVGSAGAQDDLSGNESIGFWIYADAAITSGDFDLVIDDSDGTDQTYDIGAVTANIWTWKELDISGCDANCDTMDNIKILATSQGGENLTAINIYVDGMWKWDADNEEALSTAIVQDGVLFVWTVKTDTAQANTQVVLTENTDFFLHYESGNDFIVTVTDQSTYSGMALVAY